MAFVQHDLLINNGIIGSNNTAALYCVLCERDTSYTTFTKHLENLFHQRNLQWFSLIFRTSGNNVKCAICNTVIAWSEVKKHKQEHIKIPWLKPLDNYDTYMIFFENQIFEWRNLFHCCVCAATFSSCEIALIHITDPKHEHYKQKNLLTDDFLSKISVPWDLLVREGLITYNANELQCRFCSYKSVTLSSVIRHIKGLIHVRNKSKFQLKLPSSDINNSVVTVSAKNSESEENNFAPTEFSQHEAVTTAEQELNSKEDSQQASDKSNLVTTDITNDSKHEENGFVQNETIASAENYDNATDDAQKVHGKLDFIFKTSKSTCPCIICNCIISNHARNNDKTQANHVAALKRYGCEAIIKINTTDYYCSYCDCTICSIENVFKHIIGKKHGKTLKTTTEKRENSAENFFAKAHTEFSLLQNSPCNYIVKINDTDVRCMVCNCSISAHNITSHMTGKPHLRCLKKYGCERITFKGGNMYHCGCCDVMISHPENVYVHIQEARHINSLTVSDKKNSMETMNFPCQVENSQDISNVQTTNIVSQTPTFREKAHNQSMETGHQKTTGVATWMREIATRVESPQIKTDVQEKNLTKEVRISKTSDEILIPDHILKLANTIFFCRICDCNIVPPLTVDAHVAENRHAESLEYFYNEISEIIHDKYYCKCCHWTIYGTMDNVYTHLQSKRHKQLMSTSNRNQSLKNPNSSHAFDQCSRSKCLDIAISHPENISLNLKGNLHVNSMPVTEKLYSEARMNINSNIEVPEEEIDIRMINVSSKAEDSVEGCSDVKALQMSGKKETFIEATDVRPIKEPSKVESSDVRVLDCPYSSCNYVTAKPTGLYCEICDVELSKESKDHFTGSDHLDSLKKYGCENISLQGDCYYCACCKCKICGCQNVYFHIKGRKHLRRSEVVASELPKLDVLQKKIKELETKDSGEDMSSALYSITAQISRFIEQLKRNELEDNDIN